VSGIKSRGRTGFTQVPNWRWEDPELDPFELRVAGWLGSHADHYAADHVTRNEIARRTGVSQGKVTAALAHLEDLEIIEVETVKIAQSKGGKRLVITLDLDVWTSGDPGHEVTTPGHEVTGPRSSGDQAPGHDMTANREEQRTRRTGEKNQPTSSTDRFEAFWKRYPRKIGKPKARRAFAAALRRSELAAIQQGFLRWERWWIDGKVSTEYIPYPAVWLNDERYNDEAPTVTAGESALDVARKMFEKYEAEEAASS